MRRLLTSNWLDTFIVIACSGVLFGATAAPDLYYTDCGELAGACATLGVAHPTGYPLLTLLGFGWSAMPLPLSIIGRLNLLMVILGAGGVGVFHRLLIRFLPSIVQLDQSGVRSVAAIGALLFGTARTLWGQMLSFEVHALQLLLVVLFLYWALRWARDQRHRDALVAGLSLGLCFTNHLTSIVMVPGALVLTLTVVQGNWRQRWRALVLPLFVALACAVFYAYLPFRSVSQPMFNWGEVHRGLDKFLYHVLGKQYSVWMFAGSAARQLDVFWSLLLPNVAVPLTLIGVWVLWKRWRPVAWSLLVIALVCVGYVINYSIFDIEPYFLSAFVALAIFTAVGLATLWRYRIIRPILLLLPAIYTLWNWQSNDLHAHRSVREYVKLVVDPLPKGSIVLSQQWDYFCSAFWYMQQVEGYRRDVVLVEKELLRRTWYLDQLRRWYGEPIEQCSAEIATYMPLLEEFESGQMPKQRYSVIQRAFVELLKAVIRRNPERYVFATPEVLETEPEFAATFSTVPYGAVNRVLNSGDKRQIPPPQLPDATILLASARRYHTARLDRGLHTLAAQAYAQAAQVWESAEPHQQHAETYLRIATALRSSLAQNKRSAP